MHVFSFGVKKHAVGSVGKKSVIIMIIHFCRDLTIETGKLAKFADGAAVIKVMDSKWRKQNPVTLFDEF